MFVHFFQGTVFPNKLGFFWNYSKGYVTLSRVYIHPSDFEEPVLLFYMEKAWQRMGGNEKHCVNPSGHF